MSKHDKPSTKSNPEGGGENKKTIRKFRAEHRTWTLEMFDTDTALHIYLTAKGKWIPEEEVAFTEWLGTLNLPYKEKDVITTIVQTGETITHHPNGMIVRERPGLPTEITIAEPPK